MNFFSIELSENLIAKTPQELRDKAAAIERSNDGNIKKANRLRLRAVKKEILNGCPPSEAGW